ncbi:XF1762 family protein [Pseudoxanthomonas mexicana]
MNSPCGGNGFELRPVKRDRDVRPFIRDHHRHHGIPTGYLWGHGLHDSCGELVGVATVGRPVARMLDDGLTVEVTRCCTDGSPNACSMLYGAARRAAIAKGYRRGLTYILASEDGGSLRASGYELLWTVRGRSWDAKSRRRVDKHPTTDKAAYGWGAWPQLACVMPAALLGVSE